MFASQYDQHETCHGRRDSQGFEDVQAFDPEDDAEERDDDREYAQDDRGDAGGGVCDAEGKQKLKRKKAEYGNYE